MSEYVTTEKVAKNYNEIDEIWVREDLWHIWTFKSIQKFITNNFSKKIKKKEIKILNAGSAGFSYGLSEENMIHIDIAETKISHLNNSIVCSIENIPISDNSIDLILCVGSVINYCDPMKSLQEFNRVLKSGGILILEYENSDTLELIGTKKYNKNSLLVTTFYQGKEEILFYYSTKYIKKILTLNKLKILKNTRFHILSPLIYRFIKNEKKSSVAGYLDIIFKWLPYSSNSVLLAKKI